jgi:hypothetical protein
MSELNLIWQTNRGDQTTFEFEYTTEVLFSNFYQNRIFDHGSYETVLDNSVIVYSNNTNSISEEFLSYLNKFKELDYKFYLLHYSNEDLGHNYEYYSIATHVFRNYYDSNINLDNVTFIPLGFKSGYLNKEVNFLCQDKKYNASFIGQPKRDRSEVINILEKLPNCFIHKTNSWNCHTSMSQSECADIYKNTKFVPCPMGWSHIDSFRIMESLEWGAIPVLKKYDKDNFYEKTFGTNPIPLVNNWNEIEDLIESDSYCDMSKKINDWYHQFKLELSNKIYKLIISSHE